MLEELTDGVNHKGLALFADPVHQYIPFVVPVKEGEKTEKDLIDSPYMQRLRHICQLQSARWVYPSAEHSRFQHSLGVMHVAGRFARKLYPSLSRVLKKRCPSEPFIEEILRITALLHDIGHGPWGHFFDDNFLIKFKITHEDISQQIAIEKLGDIIREIRRGPSGKFKKDEQINPAHIAFLIKKDDESKKKDLPQWLTMLTPLFNGIYTVDNLDYVLRDSYMCGVAIGPVDLERLLYYTDFTREGLTLHRNGTSALTMFLNTRLYLFSNVYYHRTTRAIDLHLKEIFSDTMKYIFPKNPLENLDGYLKLTDWSLLEEVSGWRRSKVKKKRALGEEWNKISNRQVKWKMAYQGTVSIKEMEVGKTVIKEKDWKDRIENNLPAQLNDLSFQVDMASQDPRPENPVKMGQMQIHIFDPATGKISKEHLKRLFEYIPSKVFLYRVFALNHQYDRELSEAAEKALWSEGNQTYLKTNV